MSVLTLPRRAVLSQSERAERVRYTAVVRALRDHGPQTKAELCARLALPEPAVCAALLHGIAELTVAHQWNWSAKAEEDRILFSLAPFILAALPKQGLEAAP